MKKVITYGTYDLLHYGHIALLERAKALGDYLIVGVTSDSFDKGRGKLNVQQSLAERIEGVRQTGIADQNMLRIIYSGYAPVSELLYKTLTKGDGDYEGATTLGLIEYKLADGATEGVFLSAEYNITDFEEMVASWNATLEGNCSVEIQARALELKDIEKFKEMVLAIDRFHKRCTQRIAKGIVG